MIIIFKVILEIVTYPIKISITLWDFKIRLHIFWFILLAFVNIIFRSDSVWYMLKKYTALLKRLAAFTTPSAWCLLLLIIKYAWFLDNWLSQWLKSTMLTFLFYFLEFLFYIFIKPWKYNLVPKSLFQIFNIMFNLLLFFYFFFQNLLLNKSVLLQQLIRVKIKLCRLGKNGLIAHTKPSFPQKFHFFIRVQSVSSVCLLSNHIVI